MRIISKPAKWEGYKRPLVSIIIPARDEARFIGRLLLETKDALKDISHEIIVVNDGSKDSTAQIAAAQGISVISHQKPIGKGNAIKTGTRYARGNVFIFMDGDCAHNPLDSSNLLKPIFNNEADLVIGARRPNDSGGLKHPAIRKVYNALASRIITAIILLFVPLNTATRQFNGQDPVTDCACGFRAIKKNNWDKLNISAKGFEIEAEVIYEAAKHGLTIKEVPVGFRWSNHGSHLRIIRDGLKTSFLLIKKLFKDRKQALQNHGNTNTIYCRH